MMMMVVVVVVVVVMWMGRNYVSELQPPTGLLFILLMMSEYREPRWNNIDRRKFLLLSPELSGNPASRLIW
jgi:hypothetical protein